MSKHHLDRVKIRRYVFYKPRQIKNHDLQICLGNCSQVPIALQHKACIYFHKMIDLLMVISDVRSFMLPRKGGTYDQREESEYWNPASNRIAVVGEKET